MLWIFVIQMNEFSWHATCWCCSWSSLVLISAVRLGCGLASVSSRLLNLWIYSFRPSCSSRVADRVGRTNLQTGTARGEAGHRIMAPNPTRLTMAWIVVLMGFLWWMGAQIKPWSLDIIADILRTFQEGKREVFKQTSFVSSTRITNWLISPDLT